MTRCNGRAAAVLLNQVYVSNIELGGQTEEENVV